MSGRKSTKLTDDEKQKLLAPDENDTPEVAAIKTELALTLGMPKQEREVFYQEQRVTEAEHHLQWMIDANQYDDRLIKYALAHIKKYALDIRLEGETEELLKAAEEWIQIAELTKKQKYSIADIRKQREVIWQEKKKLNKMKTSLSSEPDKSSSH